VNRATLTIALAGLLAATGLAARSASATGANYTAAQAAAGARAYKANCSRCHGVDLSGVSAPALRGAAFGGTQSVAEVYSFMVQQMPAGAPGSLSPATYTAIAAYLLQQNGHRPGTVPLTPASARALTSKF
jgi:mono/diheme cytochrome c family protein